MRTQRIRSLATKQGTEQANALVHQKRKKRHIADFFPMGKEGKGKENTKGKSEDGPTKHFDFFANSFMRLHFTSFSKEENNPNFGIGKACVFSVFRFCSSWGIRPGRGFWFSVITKSIGSAPFKSFVLFAVL